MRLLRFIRNDQTGGPRPVILPPYNAKSVFGKSVIKPPLLRVVSGVVVDTNSGEGKTEQIYTHTGTYISDDELDFFTYLKNLEELPSIEKIGDIYKGTATHTTPVYSAEWGDYHPATTEERRAAYFTSVQISRVSKDPVSNRFTATADFGFLVLPSSSWIRD